MTVSQSLALRHWRDNPILTQSLRKTCNSHPILIGCHVFASYEVRICHKGCAFGQPIWCKSMLRLRHTEKKSCGAPLGKAFTDRSGTFEGVEEVSQLFVLTPELYMLVFATLVPLDPFDFAATRRRIRTWSTR